MAVIRKLDNRTVNQIAAGEVVERPASIVKELVENSIDAGASAITVEIEQGGVSLIRVTDNGIGMDRDDAEMSFHRHATSKISDADDLDRINSLGFRGEALASIAAVTQLEMITRQPEAVSGWHIINHGGQIIDISETGCPEGTTVLVRNLFYNTPARLKFLKSSRSEAAAVSDLLAKLILANPSVSIKYISNGSTVYHSPGNGRLLSAIISVYGKNIKSDLIPVETHQENGLTVSGFIGKPALYRSNRTHQSFYVNSRYVRSPLLSQCIEEAVKEQTMINRFPWCVIKIALPAAEVDVNVHPSKTEIRFRNPAAVSGFLSAAIKKAVMSAPYVPAVFHTSSSDHKHHHKEQKVVNVNVDKQNEYPPKSENESNRKAIQEEMLPKYGMKNEEGDHTINVSDFMKLNIIGTAFSTFILAESDTELYIIDQHAAHERLIYEQLKKSIMKQEVVSQQLLPPFILEVTHDEFIAVTDNMESFLTVGFEIEPFGGKSFLIRGIPVILKEANISEIFHELLDRTDSRTGQAKLLLQDEDIIKVSCKKAVKAHDRLSQQEIRSLLKDMDEKRIPLTCPHGRPILISMSKYELEKKFKRIQ
ncbi:MAG: DNA mismatch repair endonuclease MutL [Caldicoprobacterales bacterium]